MHLWHVSDATALAHYVTLMMMMIIIIINIIIIA